MYCESRWIPTIIWKTITSASRVCGTKSTARNVGVIHLDWACFSIGSQSSTNSTSRFDESKKVSVHDD